LAGLKIIFTIKSHAESVTAEAIVEVMIAEDIKSWSVSYLVFCI